MRVLGVIPARLGSTRIPHKPLQLLAHSIAFTDPLTREPVKYSSKLELSEFPDHQ